MSRPTSRDTKPADIDLLQYFHSYLNQQTARTEVLYGGAGSAKSYSVAQHVCQLTLIYPGIIITPVRKYRPSLKRSSWRLIKEMFRSWGMSVGERGCDVVENKADLSMTLEANGSIIDGLGLDDNEKIKSYETNVVWAEEATELSKEDFMQLDLRTRRKPVRPDLKVLEAIGNPGWRKRKGILPNKLMLTLNPVDGNHWIIKDLIEGMDRTVATHHSTYRNNPYLDEATVRQIQDLINKDENWFRVYSEGLPGVLQDIIYANYTIMPFDKFPKSVRERSPTGYGEDFGFSNPSALLRGWNIDKTWYLDEVIYETGLTTSSIDPEKPSLLSRMTEEGVLQNVPQYADSAEPDRIETLRQAGYNVHEADKSSVKDSIDYVKGMRLVISAESVNTIKEIHGYKYRKLKNGVVLDEPVPFNNHAMDAMRYLIWSNREESDPDAVNATAKAMNESSLPKAFQKGPEVDYYGQMPFGGSSSPF